MLANSACASILCVVHVWLYGTGSEPGGCFGGNGANGNALRDVLLMGIMASYAAVAADTFSSELGILSKTQPVLITNPFRTVPKGTNGGVTLAGLLAGVGGSAAIAATSVLFLTFCKGSAHNAIGTFLVVSVLGTAGTLLDSFLGAILQASIVDRRSGKIVEGPGGLKVLTKSRTKPRTQAMGHDRKVSEESRSINTGTDILDNNQINFLMASIITLSGLVVGNIALT